MACTACTASTAWFQANSLSLVPYRWTANREYNRMVNKKPRAYNPARIMMGTTIEILNARTWKTAETNGNKKKVLEKLHMHWERSESEKHSQRSHVTHLFVSRVVSNFMNHNRIVFCVVLCCHECSSSSLPVFLFYFWLFLMRDRKHVVYSICAYIKHVWSINFYGANHTHNNDRADGWFLAFVRLFHDIRDREILGKYSGKNVYCLSLHFSFGVYFFLLLFCLARCCCGLTLVCFGCYSFVHYCSHVLTLYLDKFYFYYWSLPTKTTANNEE